MNTVKIGYFDAILIGNFMTAKVRNMLLYRDFLPIVAKLPGASGVKTAAGVARVSADRLNAKRPLKVAYRELLGDPLT